MPIARSLATILAALPLLASSQVAGVVKVLATYRVDDPQVLQELARRNPEHHRKVVEILRVVADADCTHAAKVIPVQFEASDVRCEPGLLLTSYPAKRELSFRLDDALYQAHVAIVSKEKVVPAIERGR